MIPGCMGVFSPLMHVPEASNREGGVEFGWSQVLKTLSKVENGF